MPTLSIIIVNYNSGNHLPRCLDSIYAQSWRDFEVIVVDNHSRDGSMAVLEKYPAVRKIFNDQNQGFAAGQNQGFRLATGQYLLALNYDLVMSSDFLAELVNGLDCCSQAGWACGKLLNMTPNGIRLNSIYAVGHVLPANRFARLRGNGEIDQGQYNQKEFVFGAPGAAALYKRKMVEDISINGQFFDQKFFTWCEDVDVDWRANLRGWKCLYAPAAVAYHVGHIHEEYAEPFRSWRAAITIRNRWFMIATNESGNGLWRSLSGLLGYELSCLRFVLRTNLIKAYLLAIYQVVRSVSYIKAKRRWVQSHAVVEGKVGEEAFGVAIGTPLE